MYKSVCISVMLQRQCHTETFKQYHVEKCIALSAGHVYNTQPVTHYCRGLPHRRRDITKACIAVASLGELFVERPEHFNQIYIALPRVSAVAL